MCTQHDGNIHRKVTRREHAVDCRIGYGHSCQLYQQEWMLMVLGMAGKNSHGWESYVASNGGHNQEWAWNGD